MAMERTWSCRVFLLLPLFMLFSDQWFANSQECQANDYTQMNRDFTEELNEILRVAENNIRRNLESSKRQRIVNWLSKIERSFELAFNDVKGGRGRLSQYCEYKKTPPGRIVQENQYLADVLNRYEYKSGKISADDKEKIVAIVRKFEDLIRPLLLKRDFAKCFIAKARNVLVAEVNGCVNDKRSSYFLTSDPADLESLEDVPLPDMSEDSFAQYMYALFNVLARGFLSIANCDDDEILRIIGGLSKHLYENITPLGPSIEYYDMCNVAEDTLDGKCICRFEEDCGDVMGCIREFVNDFESRGKHLFLWRQWLDDCKSSFGSVTGLSNLVIKALELKRAMTEVVDGGNQAVKQEIGQVVKTILNAVFRTDACGCEYSEPFQQTLSEENC